LLILVPLITGSRASLAQERPRIVFSRLQPVRIGLFLADRDGGNERPLLPATGLDYNPSFSADGKWILFTSERGGSADIYRVHPDGSGIQQLTDSPSYDDQAALSPDGHTLAFVSTRDHGTADIWLLDLASRGSTNLTRNKSGNFRPSWSPDGQWIAFSSDRDTKPGRAEPSWELLQSTAIYLIRSDRAGLRRLTELGKYYGSPQWSADGKRILCYQASPKDCEDPRSDGSATSQIVCVDVETKAITPLTSGPGFKLSPRYLDEQEIGYEEKTREHPRLAFVGGREGAGGQFHNPAWSADKSLVVYDKAVWGEPHRMTPTFSRDPAFELFLTESFPAYSPDGKQLLTAVGGEGPGTLYVMDASGSNRHKIFAAKETIVFPSWSPDGQYILFAMGGFFKRPIEPGQLAMVRADGSDFRTLTHGQASSGFPSWAPDGKRIVYRVMGKGEQGLRILSLDDPNITRLTTEYDTFPVWSPRGDLIVFTSFRDGDYEIYRIRPDGSELRKMTNDHGNDGHAIWSPDGDWIVFSSSRMGFKDEVMRTIRGPQPYGELFAMHPDGSDVRQLTDNQWEDSTAAWLPQRMTDRR
jgi:Tol biopolymer transport system component